MNSTNDLSFSGSEEMNRVRVLFFATLRDDVGQRSLELNLPQNTTLAELEDLLIGRYPRLERMRGLMLAAVNRQYAAPDQVLPKNAEVAFFPPVSGG
ncbi:MAG: molybdopterin converting factor subunit 1 [Anaerolineales bacterium]|nr:molybdopterin converting factor subunit 1 [Anaerolineales bacterium]MCX7609553.1 molybdopterin converting factor subunit 1 [Anaerolineales bacterium]MDW8227115.1 molybdopterin converting factor subunit 1 [Anaerolineales bacterium]